MRDTYFTFPDGGLRYDCAACRQRCCRGKGIALGGGELVPLLARAPALAPYLRLRPGGAVAALNLSDGCWLLQGDGLCTVEVAHGRASKPLTCRLFPFNRVYRVGDVRVVDVNSVLCPVEDAGGGGVRHAEILDEIDALSGSPLLDVPAAHPEDLPPDWLAAERRAAEAARACATDPAARAEALGEDAAASVAAWERLYGLPAADRAAAEALVLPRLALLLPSLRWNRLFRRHAAPFSAIAGPLPRRLRALLLLGALGTASQGRPPSLRALSELWAGEAPILDVLERWDVRVRLGAPRFDADIPALLQPALGAFLGGAFRGGRTLGELCEAAAASLPAEARPLAIAVAAGQLGALTFEGPAA